MTKRLLIPMSLLIAILVAGCANTDKASDNDRPQADEHQQITDELDPDQKTTPSNPSGEDKLGYVHYTKEDVDNAADKGQQSIDIDRTSLANMITRIVLENEDFDEAATLVTEDKTLIAYGKQDNLDNNEAADIVNKTAVSILPGYFDVYISDNEALIPDIQSLHNSRIQDNDYDNTINQIIDRMQESPQGTDT
ncbi:YhcN/YlaJ family sporulation lipoprotein [Barrientosiimonas marina]|uniref:YhcN/YlaJ family sporulation lipoprotein n=1 Tax=Lentibacillus kimchii TaxID=1542911 RepID=A0ABW2UTX5_9BACI